MGIWDSLRQYINDASPGGSLNPEMPKDTPVLGLLAHPLDSIRSTLNKANAQADAHLKKLDAASREMARTKSVRGPAQDAYTNEVGNWMLNTFGPLQTVWHGSPHKFDKFDASKIGTGEGAQAYGHGLYLAESPEVANGYRSNLTYKAGEVPKIAGKEVGDYYNVVMDRANRLPPAAAAKEYDKLAILEDLMGEQMTPDMVLVNASQREYPQHAVDWFKKEVVPKYEMPGAMYKVDLPDSAIAKMLDWDKTLPEQNNPALKAWFDSQKTYPGGYAYNEHTGNTLYQALRGRGMSADQASAELLNAGIPGIRYLDGGSRGTGAGTSNFVVFPGNEGLLTILERNGQPLK